MPRNPSVGLTPGHYAGSANHPQSFEQQRTAAGYPDRADAPFARNAHQSVGGTWHPGPTQRGCPLCATGERNG